MMRPGMAGAVLMGEAGDGVQEVRRIRSKKKEGKRKEGKRKEGKRKEGKRKEGKRKEERGKRREEKSLCMLNRFSVLRVGGPRSFI